MLVMCLSCVHGPAAAYMKPKRPAVGCVPQGFPTIQKVKEFVKEKKSRLKLIIKIN